jgi:hypothetical protein
MAYFQARLSRAFFRAGKARFPVATIESFDP